MNELVTGGWGLDRPADGEAAKIIQDWSSKGYITEGANGVSRDDALAAFADGKSAFVITGTWEQPKVIKGLGADAGFVALGPDRLGHPGHLNTGVGLVPFLDYATPTPF